jgi:hypothetical protein
MSKGDSARMHEEMARWELIQRVEHRDNALLLFLGAVSAIFAAAISIRKCDYRLLLIIPYLSLGITHITEHHNKMIGLLGRYLKIELESYYRSIDEYAPQWDGSRSLVDKAVEHPVGRMVAHILLIAVPAIFSLVLNLDLMFGYGWICDPSLSFIDKLLELAWRLAWILSCFLVGLSVSFIKQTDKFRKSIYDEYRKLESSESGPGNMDTGGRESARKHGGRGSGFFGVFWNRE